MRSSTPAVQLQCRQRGSARSTCAECKRKMQRDAARCSEMQREAARGSGQLLSDGAAEVLRGCRRARTARCASSILPSKAAGTCGARSCEIAVSGADRGGRAARRARRRSCLEHAQLRPDAVALAPQLPRRRADQLDGAAPVRPPRRLRLVKVAALELPRHGGGASVCECRSRHRRRFEPPGEQTASAGAVAPSRAPSKRLRAVGCPTETVSELLGGGGAVSGSTSSTGSLRPGGGEGRVLTFGAA